MQTKWVSRTTSYLYCVWDAPIFSVLFLCCSWSLIWFQQPTNWAATRVGKTQLPLYKHQFMVLHKNHSCRSVLVRHSLQMRLKQPCKEVTDLETGLFLKHEWKSWQDTQSRWAVPENLSQQIGHFSLYWNDFITGLFGQENGNLNKTLLLLLLLLYRQKINW